MHKIYVKLEPVFTVRKRPINGFCGFGFNGAEDLPAFKSLIPTLFFWVKSFVNGLELPNFLGPLQTAETDSAMVLLAESVSQSFHGWSLSEQQDAFYTGNMKK